jgi:hypothetical protein
MSANFHIATNPISTQATYTAMPMSVKKGDRFRSSRSISVLALTSWKAAFTGGNERSLPVGETFSVLHDPPESATAAMCLPERYDDLHDHFVPAEDRSAASYAGYYLVIPLRDIEAFCEQLSQ